MSFERDRGFDTFWARVGLAAPPVGFIVWSVLLAACRHTTWFWLLLGLSFAWLGFGLTVRRHWSAIHGWIATQLVRTKYAQFASAVDLAKAINEGRIRRYRVRIKGVWSDPWEVCRASAIQACRGSEVEIIVIADCVTTPEGDDPRSHVLFPPFLLFRGDGDYIEFQADAGVVFGRIETDGEPEEPNEIPVEQDASTCSTDQ